MIKSTIYGSHTELRPWRLSIRAVLSSLLTPALPWALTSVRLVLLSFRQTPSEQFFWSPYLFSAAEARFEFACSDSPLFGSEPVCEEGY